MKTLTSLLLCVVMAAMSTSAAYASKWMMPVKLKEAGVTEIQGCSVCHTSKSTKKYGEQDLNEVGKWLVEQKEARKAEKCELVRLKEYFAKNMRS